MKRIKKARASAILPTGSASPMEITMSPVSPALPAMPVVPVAPAAALPESERPSFSRIGVFGGLDGMMSMMGKVQQFFGIFQQMRPAFKLAGNLFGAKAFVKGLPSSSRTIKKQKHRSRAVAASRSKSNRKRR